MASTMVDRRVIAVLDMSEACHHLEIANIHLLRSESHMAAAGTGISELDDVESEIDGIVSRLAQFCESIQRMADGENAG